MAADIHHYSRDLTTLMRQIRDKLALVTGAASGIGRAIATRLAQEGAHLYLVDIDEKGLTETVHACRKYGVTAIGQRCDVSLSHEITETVNDILERWGGVDILVNNAGITYYGRTHKMSDDHWHRVLQINLHAHIQFTRELLPSLLARPESHVLNVCSMFGLVAMPKLSAYTVSKFGLVGLSESLRAEYGREGLGVTAMCPGFVDTNLFTSAPLPVDVDQPKAPPHWLRTTPEKVAAASVKAIRRNQRTAVVEPFARGLVLVKRFTPGLMDRLLHLGRGRRIKKKQQVLADTSEFDIKLEHRAEESEPQRRAA